jgi:hypothetical protein
MVALYAELGKLADEIRLANYLSEIKKFRPHIDAEVGPRPSPESAARRRRGPIRVLP